MTNEQVEAVRKAIGRSLLATGTITQRDPIGEDVAARAAIEAYEATDAQVLMEEAAYIRGWDACSEAVLRIAKPVAPPPRPEPSLPFRKS